MEVVLHRMFMLGHKVKFEKKWESDFPGEYVCVYECVYGCICVSIQGLYTIVVVLKRLYFRWRACLDAGLFITKSCFSLYPPSHHHSLQYKHINTILTTTFLFL